MEKSAKLIRGQKGFTVVELMIVIVIVVLLATGLILNVAEEQKIIKTEKLRQQQMGATTEPAQAVSEPAERM